MPSSKPRGRQRQTDHKTGPKGEPMTPIPSASLGVLCPRSSAANDQPSQYDTLMVQRSARDGSSFRSAVVFPGGALDLEDEAAIDATFSSSSPASKTTEGYLMSLKLCALRESFEETGLLLIPSPSYRGGGGPPLCRAIGNEAVGMSLEEWNEIRDDVHQNATFFIPFLQRVYETLGIKAEPGSTLPPLAPMAHHSNWITPRSVVRPAKRFDAHFFLTVLDTSDAFGTGQKTLGLSADGAETLSLRLGTPGEIMQLGMDDKISLFPPQFYILADLEEAIANKTVDALSSIQPLIFGPKQSAKGYDKVAELRVTPVEEYRGEKGKNYTWDRKDVNDPKNAAPPTSWVSDTEPPLSKSRPLGEASQGTVTSIEPRPFPKQGSMVTLREPANEDDDSNTPFVFPLVIPGDWQASPSQKERAIRALSGDAAASAAAREQDKDASEKPLNRLFVSPRAREHGGGMTVRGCIRRGIGSLPDFQVGIILEDAPSDTPSSKL